MTRRVDPAELRDALRQELERDAVPGGALAVAHGGGLVRASEGVADVASGREVDAHTQFRLASLTKPMVATAIVRLAETGALELDEPVRRHLPDFQLQDEDAAARVSIADLLSHRGGWSGDFIDFDANGDDGLAVYVEHLRDAPQILPPGIAMSYSNAGYAVLGRILEVVSGEPFERSLSALVFEPFGMATTHFADPDHAPSIAEGYVEGLPVGASAGAYDHVRWPRPSGGVIAEVADLVAFAEPFANVRTSQLPATLRERMSTPVADAVGVSGLADHIALGWMVTEVDGQRVLSHTGDIMGHHSLLVAVPESGFVFAIAFNAQEADAAAERLAKWALAEFTGLRWPTSSAAPATVAATAQLCGRFDSSLSVIDVTAGHPDGVDIVIERKPLMPGVSGHFAFTGQLLDDDRIALIDEAGAQSRARVVRDPSGAMTYLRIDGRLARRVG